jgi:hypothetical protein
MFMELTCGFERVAFDLKPPFRRLLISVHNCGSNCCFPVSIFGELTANHSTPVRRELAKAHGVSSSAIRSLRMNAQSMSSAMDGPRAFPISVSAYSTFGGTWG